MSPARCTLLALGLLGLLHGAAMAAPSRWAGLADPVFHPLSTEEGLQSIQTLAVAQNRAGFLWIGTDDGLARWDGYRMRIYRPIAGDAHALPGIYVQELQTDRAGRLWVGTASGGLARYNPDTDDFTPVLVAGEARRAFEIRAMCMDGANGLWVAGTTGLYHLDPDAAGPPTLRRDPELAADDPDDVIQSCLAAPDGTLWIGTNHGLYRRAAKQPGMTPHMVGVDLPEPGKGQLAIDALLLDHAGRLWVGSFGAGAFVLAPGAAPRQIIEPADSANPVQTLDVESLIEPEPGTVWLGTTGYGIISVRLEPSGASIIRHITHDPSRATSLAADVVGGLFRDHVGAIWVATDNGLSRYSPNEQGVSTLFGATGRALGISDPDLLAVLGRPDGRIWLGLEHDGVDILNPDATAPQPWITHLAAGHALPDTIVDGLAALASGGVFIATWQGLFHADDDGRQVSLVALPGEASHPAVLAAGQSAQALWFATARSLYTLDAADIAAGAPYHPRHILSSHGLTDSRMRVILPDPSGKLWIGTWDGLNLADPATGKIVQFRAEPTDKSALSAGLITSLLFDGAGRLWVGTTGGGITILPAGIAERGSGEARPAFLHIGVADGLPKSSVDMLLRGPQGDIWASTDDGLARIDPATLHVRSLHVGQGVAISAYWGGSGAVSSRGEILFGGSGGLTVISPNQMRPAGRRAPPLVVTDLRLGLHRVPAGRLNEGRILSPLVIKPAHPSLSVEFSTLDFADPARARYAYRLTGIDTGWIETDPSRRAATYTNLPPGRFTLLLKGADIGQPSLETVLRIPVLVLPAWYQTTWFTALCAGLALAGIVAMLRLQALLLRRRQRALEKLIAQRTVELSRSNQALLRSAETLRELSLIGQEITASLNVETILPGLYAHLARLLRVRGFEFYAAPRASDLPILCFGVQNGELMAEGTPASAEDAALLSQTMSTRQAIICDSTQIEAHGSLVCAPLIVKDQAIGAIKLEASLPDGDTGTMMVIVRTIAAYGAIALENAETVKTLADMRSQLQELAYSDGLTNLPNRRMFLEQFERFREQSLEHGSPFTLLVIDLDDFKLINDSYGHDTGDATLVETARRLQSVVRGRDCVLRLGGDEFAILLADTGSLEAIEFICRRIAESFEWPLRFNDLSIQASTSIGAATFPEDGRTHDYLYKAADLALYAAKRAGRRTWRKYDPGMATLEQLEE